ncbi:MAG: response regulator [Bdellovibrionota bacterium]|nr:response regulator [Bdellovibrionota bacterium]
MAKTFLIVDDEAKIADILGEFIEDFYGEDSRIVKAFNGKEALTSIDKEDHIDLIFLDIIMPELNGIKFIEKLRNERGISTPVLVVSASVEEAKEKTSKFSKVGYLSKPIFKEEFDEAINKLLS